MEKKETPKEKKKKKQLPGVRERKGRFTYRYSVEVVQNGKSHRKQKETPAYSSAQEAYEAGIIIKAQQIQGVYVDESNITFADWADKWMDIYEESGKKPHSIVARRNSLTRPIERFGMMKLKDIKPMQYQEFLLDLKREGLKRNTLLSIHSTMSLLFKKAVRPPYEIIARDITKDVDLPAYSQTVEELEQGTDVAKYMEKEELAEFLQTAWRIADEQADDKERLIARQYARMLHILAYTGLRIGELCGLERARIDVVNQQLRIIKTLYAMEGVKKYKLSTPKNKKSIRDVDITKRVLSLFAEQERERKQVQLLSSRYYRDREFVFANARRAAGYPLSPRDLERFMKVVLEKANMNLELTPHSLRHTYTSLMAEAGVELAAIQRQLGHSNDKTTTQIYLHVTKARRRTDVEKLEALMNQL